MAGAGMGGSAGIDGGGGEGTGGASACASQDLSSDPAHCGACHHDCLGGGCGAGLCQPVEIGQAGPMPEGYDAVLVGDSHLFLVSMHSGLAAVAKMPKSGGILEEVLPAIPLEPASLALSGGSLFFSDQKKASDSYRILELPPSGGALSAVWQAGDSLALDLTPDGEGLLFVTRGSTVNESVRVMRLRPADGVAEELADLPGDWFSARVWSDDDAVYLFAGSSQVAGNDPPSTSIYRISKGDSSAQLVAWWQTGGTYGAIPAGPDLYFLAMQNSSQQLHSLMRMPKSGGQASLVLDVDPASSIQPVAFDAQRVWWLLRQGGWNLPEVRFMTTPLAGGASTFVTGDVLASNVAYDSTCLYWIRQSGAVMRLVR